MKLSKSFTGRETQMKIKVKTQEFSAKLKKWRNKTVLCDVASRECGNYECLHVGEWLHQNKSIDGVQSSYRDNFYSCLYRNYHGCPDKPKIKNTIKSKIVNLS